MSSHFTWQNMRLLWGVVYILEQVPSSRQTVICSIHTLTQKSENHFDNVFGRCLILLTFLNFLNLKINKFHIQNRPKPLYLLAYIELVSFSLKHLIKTLANNLSNNHQNYYTSYSFTTFPESKNISYRSHIFSKQKRKH